MKKLTNHEWGMRILLPIAILASLTLTVKWMALLQAAVCAFSLGFRIGARRGEEP